MFKRLPPVLHLRQSHDLRAGEPGRFVLVNDDDDDQDGILDYDDGYNENEDPCPFLLDDDDVTYEEDDFVMLKVKIAPTSIDLDPNKAWVDVQYSADSPDPDVWGSGRIRLWKKPGDQPRDNRSALPDFYAGEGDWIGPGLYTDLGELTPSGTASHEMTFYIEGVNPSGTLGDTDITFRIDPDGEGPASYVHMDTVQVTVVDINIETDSDNNTTINAADNMIEDEFPGRAMWPNADNDNHATDDHADLEENGQVLGENDLAEIHVDVLPEIPGLMVKLEASPANLVKVWLQADKSTPAPMEWNAQNLPYTLWVEGLADPGTTTLTLSLVSSPGAKDSVKMTVFKVVDVYWVEHEGNPSLTGCPKNGGKRIFADDEAPNESGATSDNRKKVDIVGWVSPAPLQASLYMSVWLKKWDVDDPSADGDVVDDLPRDGQEQFVANAGPDNRSDQSGTVWPEIVLPNGRFTTWMYVSPQPGNNYSVTATTTRDAHENYLKQEWVDQAVREHRDCVPSDSDCYAVVSNMLTVWRRLWLEVDSMAAEAPVWNWEARRTMGSLQLVIHDPSFNPWVVHDTPATGLASVHMLDPAGQCEGGALLDPNDPGSEYLAARSFPTLIVWGYPSTAVNDDRVLLDDDSWDLQLPDYGSFVTNEFTNAFAAAYVSVSKMPPTWNPNTDVDFFGNLSDEQLDRNWSRGDGINAARNLTDRKPSFWWRHVVMCYQGPVDKDRDGDINENCEPTVNDPDTPGSCDPPYEAVRNSLPLLINCQPDVGATVGSTRLPTVFLTPVPLSVIHKEVQREVESYLYGGKIWQFAAHEIGHGTYPYHGGTAEHAEGGLMIEGGPHYGPPELPDFEERRFLAPTLARFRSATHW